MEPLAEDRIDKALKGPLNKWTYSDDKLQRNFQFGDFREAVSFIVRVGFEAESQMHHPELFNVFNKVSISLSTHDAGNKVTEKDLKLAKAIEEIFSDF